MGRYYSGDIEGKFRFGVQDSHDALFFGGQEFVPATVDYYFTKDDLPKIEEGISKCVKKLGTRKDELEGFFAEHLSYSTEEIMDAIGVSRNRVDTLLEWYARHGLGVQIRDKVKEAGECRFSADV